MLKLIIEDDEGRKTVVPFVREEITIGRQEGNTIRLTERNVSRKHARLLRQNGAVVVEDLGSYTGIRVNGERVTGQSTVKDGDLIQIGDYDLTIQQDGAVQAAPPAPPRPPSSAAGRNGAKAEEPETEADTPIYKPLETEEQRKQATSIIRIDGSDGGKAAGEIEEVDVSDAPRLVLVNTEAAGQEFACIRTELKIGRVSDNDIAIDHRSLSRTHAKLVRKGNGEWQLQDLQSANGLTVNGEPYAQATLKNRDILELGHVQLQFLEPGEKYSASAARRGGKGKSRAGLLVVAAIAVIGGGAAAVFILGPMLGLSGQPKPKQPEVVNTKPPEPKPPEGDPAVDPAVAAAEAAKLQADAEAKARADAEAAALGDTAKKAQVDKAVADAKLLFEKRKLTEALALLTPFKDEGGRLPPEAEDLSDKVNAERLVQQHLQDAEKALAAKNTAGAKQHLDDSEGTQLFAAELSALRKKVDAAGAPPEVKPPEVKTVGVVKPGTKPSKAEEVKKAFDEGTSLFKAKQLAAARTQFKKCVDLDANHAPCHMMLGSTYAKLGEVDRGADHYRKFVKLAPSDPQAARVKVMLEQYEASKKGAP